ncbi:MAG: ABC-F family ATP-binding cassette domain-containing protein [Oscillospiraceae bacterium]|nr:ABC-F family ATP-binding cassette domain-containing protein [Oscillospiraceae bacterium]
MLLSLQDIGISFSGNTILEHISGDVQEASRIGLIGANGAGKSTLLNMICGDLENEWGEISRRSGLVIGYLRQNSGLSGSSTILQEMQKPFAALLKAKEELDDLRLGLADVPPSSGEYHRLAEEYDRKLAWFEANEGYHIDVKIQTVLGGMGFSDKDHATPIDTLSGGEKTRLALAKLLLSQPELLILDEPTNHLDFRTLRWLEDYLQSYRGAIIVVSHDRYFLDKTVKEIWEVEFQSLRIFPGNYSKYKELKADLMARWEKEYEAQQEEIADLEDFVARNLVRASTSKSAKARVKKLERMERIDRPREYDKRISLRFAFDRDPVKEVLTASELSLTVGEDGMKKHLFDHLSFEIRRGDKVAVIGENGIGKSSLLKGLLGQIPFDSGRYRWGGEVKVSYFDQENRQLHPNMTVLEELWSRYPRKNETEIRTELGRVLLTGEDVYKKVSVLSGGERAKLSFAVLMAQRGNFLMLDEPTNHLDLQSKELLEDALAAFPGTMLFVSHDRYLLRRVPDKIIEIFDDHVEVFPGNYDYYMEKMEERAAAEAQAERAAKQETPPSAEKAAFYKSKQQKAEEAKARARAKALEKRLEELDAEIAAIEAELAEPDMDYKRLEELCAQLEEKRTEQNDAMEEWMALV